MTTPEVAKLVSKEWKELSEEDRTQWHELARKDRERFDREKEAYEGPWKVSPDHVPPQPQKPRRPVSTVLLFAAAKREAAKQAYPMAKSAEITRILSKMWKSLPDDQKAPYVQEANRLQKVYRIQRESWHKAQSRAKEEETKTQRSEDFIQEPPTEPLRINMDGKASPEVEWLGTRSDEHSLGGCSSSIFKTRSLDHTWQLSFEPIEDSHDDTWSSFEDQPTQSSDNIVQISNATHTRVVSDTHTSKTRLSPFSRMMESSQTDFEPVIFAHKAPDTAPLSPPYTRRTKSEPFFDQGVSAFSGPSEVIRPVHYRSQSLPTDSVGDPAVAALEEPIILRALSVQPAAASNHFVSQPWL